MDCSSFLATWSHLHKDVGMAEKSEKEGYNRVGNGVSPCLVGHVSNISFLLVGSWRGCKLENTGKIKWGTELLRAWLPISQRFRCSWLGKPSTMAGVHGVLRRVCRALLRVWQARSKANAYQSLTPGFCCRHPSHSARLSRGLIFSDVRILISAQPPCWFLYTKSLRAYAYQIILLRIIVF